MLKKKSSNVYNTSCNLYFENNFDYKKIHEYVRSRETLGLKML